MCALSLSYFTEYFYKLIPCRLCVYERYFLIAIALSSGYNIFWPPKKHIVPTLLFAAFSLSIFHILVEQNILVFQCKSTDTPTIESFLKMLSTPNCNYPTWEIFGISATIYYTILTGGLFVISIIYIILCKRQEVFKVYEKIAAWFDSHRSRDLFEKSWLDKAIFLLHKKAHILDLGCGMGEPIIPYFLENGFSVTGVDGSKKLIELAKPRFPNVKFIVADMRKLNLNQEFDLIVAWNSFFHLPQNDQRNMFKIFASHLNDGGVLLFTSGPKAGEVWSNNGGENLYHASLSPNEYKALLEEHGFILVEHKISDPECVDATVWLAQLKNH